MQLLIAFFVQTDTISFTVTGVFSCADLLTALDTYVKSGQFVIDANTEDIPLLAASLVSALCTGPSAGTSTVTNAPAPGMRLTFLTYSANETADCSTVTWNQIFYFLLANHANILYYLI